MLQLKNFPDIPISTREEAGEFCPHPEEPRFRLLAREEGSFPCVVGKEFPAFLSQLKRRRSPQERREELQSPATFQSPPDVSVHSRETCFPCTASTFNPRIHSYHVGTWDSPVVKPRGKAWWESVVGKPGGKASCESLEGKPQIPSYTRREGCYCSYSSGGKCTCMPSLETRPDSPGKTPGVPQTMSALERNTQVPAPSPHKVLGPSI